MRRLFILSSAEAPEEPVQGGEYHASPSVGLQAPVAVLVVSLLPDDSGAEEEDEVGGASTGLACTTTEADGVEEMGWDVMTGDGTWASAPAVVVAAAWREPTPPVQE